VVVIGARACYDRERVGVEAGGLVLPCPHRQGRTVPHTHTVDRWTTGVTFGGGWVVVGRWGVGVGCWPDERVNGHCCYSPGGITVPLRLPSGRWVVGGWCGRRWAVVGGWLVGGCYRAVDSTHWWSGRLLRLLPTHLRFVAPGGEDGWAGGGTPAGGRCCYL